MTITNYDDVIDSRDVISAIADLEPWKVFRIGTYDGNGDYTGSVDIASFKTEVEAWQFMADEDYDPVRVAVELNEDESEELDALVALQEEAEPLAPDWENGQSLIRDSYFEQFAEEYAEEAGLIDPGMSWPLNYIDWEAAAQSLQQDYSLVSFDGISYWIGN